MPGMPRRFTYDALGFTLFVGFFFFFQAIFMGWDDALRSTISLAFIMVGFYVTKNLSLDARLASQGLTAKGHITERSSLPVNACCGGGHRHLVRYTYTVDGTTYSNTDAWFDYSSPPITTNTTTDNGNNPTEEEEVLEVAYLVGAPRVSLPKSTRLPYGVAPSAGSLNHVALNSNHGVFILLVVAMDVAALSGLAVVLDNDLVRTTVAHAVGVPVACFLYCRFWMKPREARQQFLVSEAILHGDHIDSETA